MTAEKPIPDLTPVCRHRLREMVRAGKSASRNNGYGGIPRRDFITCLGAMGAGAAASATLLGTLREAVAQTPKRGGRLIIASDTHGPNDTLDPALLLGRTDYFRARMFYGSLVRLTEKLTWEPELAEEVIPNDDATIWTFKIRRGIIFHDGKSLDADDVLYSMNRHLGDASISAAKQLVSMITRWEKVNQYELRAILATPYADLPVTLGTFHFKIVQNGTQDFSRAIGTGPYKLKEFKAGVRCIGVRNPDYWEEGGYLDEIEHYGITDPVARLNAFLAGDVDVMVDVAPKLMPRITATAGRDLWVVESNSYTALAARHDRPLSGNADLRRALQYLQDRRRLVQGTLKGEGAIANDQPIGPAYPDHSADVPMRMLDPEKAAFHFKKSGIGNSEVEVFTAAIGPTTVDACLFMQREARKIGLNIKVNQVPADGYLSAFWNKVPIAVSQWNMRPTANIMMSLAFHSASPWNDTRWHNDAFDKLLIDARAITDPVKRKQVYHDLQMMIYEGNGQAIPCYSNYIDAAASYVKGRTAVPLAPLGGCESPRTLWRDDA